MNTKSTNIDLTDNDDKNNQPDDAHNNHHLKTN